MPYKPAFQCNYGDMMQALDTLSDYGHRKATAAIA